MTLLLSAILYGGGTRSGVFALQRTELLDHNLYWSWPLFLAIFCLSRALLWVAWLPALAAALTLLLPADSRDADGVTAGDSLP
jgi:hypothetical protein